MRERWTVMSLLSGSVMLSAYDLYVLVRLAAGG
jgi:hypothetical protein